jgi:hypothetical protein
LQNNKFVDFIENFDKILDKNKKYCFDVKLDENNFLDGKF